MMLYTENFSKSSFVARTISLVIVLTVTLLIYANFAPFRAGSLRLEVYVSYIIFSLGMILFLMGYYIIGCLDLQRRSFSLRFQDRFVTVTYLIVVLSSIYLLYNFIGNINVLITSSDKRSLLEFGDRSFGFLKPLMSKVAAALLIFELVTFKRRKFILCLLLVFAVNSIMALGRASIIYFLYIYLVVAFLTNNISLKSIINRQVVLGAALLYAFLYYLIIYQGRGDSVSAGLVLDSVSNALNYYKYPLYIFDMLLDSGYSPDLSYVAFGFISNFFPGGNVDGSFYLQLFTQEYDLHAYTIDGRWTPANVFIPVPYFTFQSGGYLFCLVYGMSLSFILCVLVTLNFRVAAIYFVFFYMLHSLIQFPMFLSSWFAGLIFSVVIDIIIGSQRRNKNKQEGV